MPQIQGQADLRSIMTQRPFSAKLDLSEMHEQIKMKHTFWHRQPAATLCFSLLFGSLFAGAADAQKTRKPHLHIVQVHNVLGPIEIFASPGVSVMKLRKLECSIFMDSKEKNPDVLVVAPEKRLYCQIPLNRFEYGLASTLDTVTDLEMNPKHWRLVQRKMDGALILSNYTYESSVRNYKTFSAYIPGKSGNIAVKSEISTVQSSLATPEFCLLLKKMEHVPGVGGVPIKMRTAYSSKGRFRNQLSTDHAEVFQMPELARPQLSGFKKVSKSSDIFFEPVTLLDNLLSN